MKKTKTVLSFAAILAIVCGASLRGQEEPLEMQKAREAVQKADVQSDRQDSNRPWEPTGKETPQSMKTRTSALNHPRQAGAYYQAAVPDTLDLAERARLGLNHFVGITDDNYEMCFAGGPGGLGHQFSPLMACQPKAATAMAMERLMTGSQQGLDREAKMLDMLASNIGEDGIYWVPLYPDRPWLGPPETLPRANVHGQARMIEAMIAWYQYTGNPRWKELIDRMIDGLDRRMVVHKDDYAYFPSGGWFEDNGYFRASYSKKGWKDISEPKTEKDGEEGSLFNSQGHTPGALANWYLLTGNKQALRLAGELARFLTKPKFWADSGSGDFPAVIGAENAHWRGHVTGHLNTLRAILNYAIAANDTQLMEFCRAGYEWARRYYFSNIGFSGGCCGHPRLLALAVKLTTSGVGDYWEDIDRYIRNQVSEMQFTPDDIPYYGSGPGLPGTVGSFGHQTEKESWSLCCTSHGNMALFFVWDSMLSFSDGVARVNLLLNRASPWMDIDSYLPYQGKVVLKNKTAREALVRIPLWVDKKSVKCLVENKNIEPSWDGMYLRIRGLEPASVVTIEFPMVERTETRTVAETWGVPHGWPVLPVGTVLRMRFRGNTVTEITPPLLGNSTFADYQGKPTSGPPCPSPYQFRRAKLQSPTAPMVKVTRYVTTQTLRW